MRLKSLFSFHGRYSRKQYLLIGIGLASVVAVVLAFVGVFVAAMLYGEAVKPYVDALAVLFCVPGVVISLAATSKRLHDLGQSGWLSVLSVLPLVSLGVFGWLAVTRGNVGANAYGADPLDPAGAAIMPVAPAPTPAAIRNAPGDGEINFKEWPSDVARRTPAVADVPRAPVTARTGRGPSLTLHLAGRGAIRVSLDSPVTLGRNGGCELPLPDDHQASSRHARLSHDRGVVTLVDLASSNGTFLNGTRIHGTEPISDGDLILVGATEIRVRL